MKLGIDPDILRRVVGNDPEFLREVLEDFVCHARDPCSFRETAVPIVNQIRTY